MLPKLGLFLDSVPFRKDLLCVALALCVVTPGWPLHPGERNICLSSGRPVSFYRRQASSEAWSRPQRDDGVKTQGRVAAPGPVVPKKGWEERGWAGVWTSPVPGSPVCSAICLGGQAGTQALRRLGGPGELPLITSSTLKEAFLGSVTGEWDHNSVWGDTPEAPQEVPPSQPCGRASPGETGLHR